MKRMSLISCLACALWPAVFCLAGVYPAPIVVPGTTMPDGNGYVKGAQAFAQLSDGRLLVGIDISGAISPVTGFHLPTNYGGYNYTFATGRLVREFRHEYPSSEGGVPDSIGFYAERIDIPLVLDDGDRIYRGGHAVRRYTDDLGMVYGSDVSTTVIVGRDGIIGAPTWPHDAYQSLTHEEHYMLLDTGDTLAGIPTAVRGGMYARAVCPDGSHLITFSEYNLNTKHSVRLKPGEPYDPIDHLFPEAVSHGYSALGFVGDDIGVQSALHQPYQVTLAYGASIVGDYRVNMGGKPTSTSYTPVNVGFAEGGFVGERIVYDSRTDTMLGKGLCFFDVNGALVSSLLPDDPNPFGPGTFQTLRTRSAQYRASRYHYQNEFALAIEVQIAGGGATDRAWWMMHQDGSLEQAFAVGLPVAADPSYTILGGSQLGNLTSEGRAIYSILGENALGDQRRWTACYSPGVGLAYDMEGAYTPAAVGPHGARVYCTDDEIWKAQDGAASQLLVANGMDVGDGYMVTDLLMCGVTPDEDVVFRLTLHKASSADKNVFYLHDGLNLIELFDRSAPFDGKTVSTSYPPEFQMDENNWIFVMPNGRPIVRISFADGTSGLYGVPEPGSIALVGLGAMWLLRRGRRGRTKGCSRRV